MTRMAVTFSRDLTIPHLDLSHFALSIMGSYRHLASRVQFSRSCSDRIYRLQAKKGPAPPPPLGNFADISYLEENFKPHLLSDVCTLCSGALVSESLLHMLL